MTSTQNTSQVATVTPDIMPERVLEIALLLQERRYHQFGSQHYIAELKQAASELGIPDRDIHLFYQKISHRMTKTARQRVIIGVQQRRRHGVT